MFKKEEKKKIPPLPHDGKLTKEWVEQFVEVRGAENFVDLFVYDLLPRYNFLQDELTYVQRELEKEKLKNDEQLKMVEAMARGLKSRHKRIIRKG